MLFDQEGKKQLFSGTKFWKKGHSDMSSLNLQAKQCMQTTWHTHFVELTTVPKNFYFLTI